MKNYLPWIFPFLFVGWWCFVELLLSMMSGWHRLGKRYRASAEPDGTTFRMQSAIVGKVTYNCMLKIVISQQGLYLSCLWPFRFAHPALLIPWRDIYHVTFKKFLWIEMVRFDISLPPFATFQINKKVFEAARPFLDEVVSQS